MNDPLGHIQHAAAQQVRQPQRPQSPGAVDGAEQPSFKDMLSRQINEVNRVQQDAEMAIEDLVSGRREDVDAVFLAKQKADIAFQMLLQVRNKMMQAYDEVKQIRV